MVLGACGAMIGSCLGSMACAGCCRACKCKCMVPPQMANYLYCALLCFSTIAALILRLRKVPLRICLDVTGADCKGSSWASRNSFS